MHLSRVKIKNYRLIANAEIAIDNNLTLIVGRNNTAKTSCISLIKRVIEDQPLNYDDYPLDKREVFYSCLCEFLGNKKSYEDFCSEIPLTSIDFIVDYSLDNPENNLGALSPFIIDVDIDISSVLIRAIYKINMDENRLRELLNPYCFTDGEFCPQRDRIKRECATNFSKIFGLAIYAVNPKNDEDVQIKNIGELKSLFPFELVPAERILGEDGVQNKSSLNGLITKYFDVDINTLDPKVAKDVQALRSTVNEANLAVQERSDKILSSLVNDAIGFGYPNTEELQLGVSTNLQIDDQIKNQTELNYVSSVAGEKLPSSYNGLGYKNLIKIAFLLAEFSRRIGENSVACIPLLFLEEPESHMHPQMQRAFAEYLYEFAKKISSIQIQTIMTTHSAHIANSIDFAQIRYAQKTKAGVIYKNLKDFASQENANTDFIKKYLTLSRCDLFFADKAILIEGASERLLIPDMIEKCEKEKIFDSQEYKLPAQYYALIEVGGAYAHKFIPFIKFLGIPCLILTDIDPIKEGKKALVSEGDHTSNATLIWWTRRVKEIPDAESVTLTDIRALTGNEKTIENCHLEFQVDELGVCGRSLEEAIKNVNREYFEIAEQCSENDLAFAGACKTDFALELIYKCPNYAVPKYIKDGLTWLNNQQVLI